ncbi:SOS response-associated peptidase [Aquirufa aurantiipilula]|uniref:SOS response-associated peptidase n=1 Tax=Aquirufa aurantiipilula TaxID=2696561 RepID=UPI001CAA78F9|nr:SOS response-associated peptidase [Aquirufa aurantiipilula]MBZ1327570.1 SOS response-associated peptidase [Aquirufa aurantiipilula]
MCYYTDQTSSNKALEIRFKAQAKYEESLAKKGKISGFTRAGLPIITQAKPELIQLFPWGLIPAWANEEQAKELPKNTLNAKSESIFEKASFEPSILKQRCLVLVDGFYEWQHVGKEKIEYHIHLKTKGPFALAGIYAIWHNPRTKNLEPSFSIITTPANDLMETIHNTKKRMPLILSADQERNWLAPMSSEEIKTFFKPFDSASMQAQKVKNLGEQTQLFA